MLSLLLFRLPYHAVECVNLHSVTDVRDASSVVNQSGKTVKTIYVGVSKTWIEVEGLTRPDHVRKQARICLRCRTYIA